MCCTEPARCLRLLAILASLCSCLLIVAQGCKVGDRVVALHGLPHSDGALFRCQIHQAVVGNGSLAHHPDARCWQHAVVRAERGSAYLDVVWEVSKAASRIERRHALHIFDRHTMRCDRREFVPARARWSPDFIADVLADPHPLCYSSKAPFVGKYLASELREVLLPMPFDGHLLGDGNRQPAGARQLQPHAPPYDPFFKDGAFQSGVTVAHGRRGAIVGATVHLLEEPYVDGGIRQNWRMGEDAHSFVILGMNPGIIKGRSFLEVAALDGMNCFHAEWLGASEVMCVDYQAWGGGHEDPNTFWQGFLTEPLPYINLFKATHCLRQSKVHAMRLNVYDMSLSILGRRFDIVRAFGLLYHLKHPLVALEALSEVTAEALVLETEALVTKGEDAAMCQWFRGAEFAGDASNFFACNNATLTDWLFEVGFADVAVIQSLPGTVPDKFSTARLVYAAVKPGASVRVADFQDYR